MTCYRCKAEAPDEQRYCGSCGYQLKRSFKGLYVISIVLIAVLAVGKWVFDGLPRSESRVATGETLLSASAGGCSPSDIQIKSSKIRFENACQTRQCMYMKGVAVLVNNCQGAIGVQIKITGFDRAGAPVATKELWPNSTNNIAPGEFIFSVDQWLEYEPEMVSFTLTPVRVRQW